MKGKLDEIQLREEKNRVVWYIIFVHIYIHYPKG